MSGKQTGPAADFVIERMREETVSAVAALEKECFTTPWSEKSLAWELTSPLAVFFTLSIDGQVAGYAGMHHILDEGCITNVATGAAFRRRGVASALLERLIAYGKENALVSITLEVRASNLGAVALYERHRFREEGRRANYYTKPTEDALIMTLWLRDPPV